LGPLTKRVHSTFEEPIDVDGLSITMSASIGIVLGDGTETAEAMLTEADEAMFLEKQGSDPPPIVAVVRLDLSAID